MFKVKSLMCILALTFFLAGSLPAQDSSSSQGTQAQPPSGQSNDNMHRQDDMQTQNQDPQKALATDLQARINLTQQQTQQVQDILSEYQSSSASTEEGTSKDAETSANDKIASLLDDNQKASFESVKSDWWNEVKERLSQNAGDQMDNNGTMDQNGTNGTDQNGTDDNGTNSQETQSDTTKY